jgi:signal transduction histidine kinase
LGLSISRRLMRDQGGDVVYEEAAGGGACLTIVLPAAGEETA